MGMNARYIEAHRLAPFSFRSTDIGVVLDLMIHDLDLVLGMVQSPIESVEAFGGGAAVQAVLHRWVRTRMIRAEATTFAFHHLIIYSGFQRNYELLSNSLVRSRSSFSSKGLIMNVAFPISSTAFP